MGVRLLAALRHLVRADFLERVRRYSFMITLGAMLYVGYAAVPAPSSGVLTVNLAASGNLRGLYNSAWIGSMVALLSSMVLSLPGFYLVKNALSRDRETRVGQVIATTPLRRLTYTLGKGMSNWLFLFVTMLVVAVAAAGMQWLRGEVLRIRPWELFAPFLFVTVPTMALVAATAIFFETVRFLRGGFGNIVYFVLYLTVLIISMSASSVSSQGVIVAPVNDPFGATRIAASMLQQAATAYPDRPLEIGIGYIKADGPVDTFSWPGVHWTPGAIGGRLVWLGVAVAIVAVSALLFQRFDPAHEKPKSTRRGPWARLVALSRRLLVRPRSALGRRRRAHPVRRVTPLLPPWIRVLVAELRLTLKGQPWWWYAIALALVVAGLTTPTDAVLRPVLALAWVWPILMWSGLGVREQRYQTERVVFSAPKPLFRQLGGTWLAGVLVTVLMGSGVALRLILVGSWAHLAGWGVAVLFIPTLALAFGIWSGTSRLFEAVYVIWWYIGPLQGTPGLDFMSLSEMALQAKLPLGYLLATGALLVLAFLGRWRKIGQV